MRLLIKNSWAHFIKLWLLSMLTSQSDKKLLRLHAGMFRTLYLKIRKNHIIVISSSGIIQQIVCLGWLLSNWCKKLNKKKRKIGIKRFLLLMNYKELKLKGDKDLNVFKTPCISFSTIFPKKALPLTLKKIYYLDGLSIWSKKLMGFNLSIYK